jgi:hypothetical protein
VDEAQWLACADPKPMLDYLYRKVSQRKLRLFGCACLRLIWSRVPAGASRHAVETAERYVDEQASGGEMALAARANKALRYTLGFQADQARLHWSDPDCAAYYGAVAVAAVFADSAWWAAVDACDAVLELRGRTTLSEAGQRAAYLVREICGNPFDPPPAVDPACRAWKGGAVRQLAEAAYQERQLPSGELDRTRLAVIADALEESGCAEPSLLTHLRSPGPHVRGCFVIDALTGRS